MQRGLGFDDETPSLRTWRVRDFNGYHQSREGGAGPWRFYVSGFGRVVAGEHVECTVLRADGTYEVVPIDGEGRITILDRKYSQRFWSH